MIVLPVPAVQSFPDVTYGSEVDSTPMGTPIGMYVCSYLILNLEQRDLLSDDYTLAQKQQLKEMCVE